MAVADPGFGEMLGQRALGEAFLAGDRRGTDVEHERDAKAVLDRIPDERRATLFTATPAQAAERLSPYLDAGFGGFTLSNQTLPAPDAIALGGELIRLMNRTRSAV